MALSAESWGKQPRVLREFLFTGEKMPFFPYGLLPGSASRLDTAVGPLVPAQVTRVTAVSAPAVTFMATNLMDQARAGRSCPRVLMP